jgi:hypothetical protein
MHVTGMSPRIAPHAVTCSLRRYTGVKTQCPLRFVPLFDMVWDFAPDMMHITKGVWSYHLMDTLRGSRTLTRPAYIQKLTPAENQSLQADYRARNQELKTWELSRVHKLLFFII